MADMYSAPPPLPASLVLRELRRSAVFEIVPKSLLNTIAMDDRGRKSAPRQFAWDTDFEIAVGMIGPPSHNRGGDAAACGMV